MRTVLLSLVIIAVIAVPGARAVDAVVVKSSDIRLYDTAISGFKKDFPGSVAVLSMKTKNLIEQIRDKQPRVIIAVGLSATRSMTAVFTRIPIVFCMTMHQRKHKLKTANSTGVDIGPRPREQLLAFARVIPGLNRLGLIYDPKVSGVFVARAQLAARELGLDLVTRKVSQRSQVLKALRNVAGKSDAVWLIRDQTVMSREFFNYALILQADKKIPLFAFSPVFVEKGAVASYASEYQAQGKLAAKIAADILQGADPAEIQVQSPSGTLYINTRAARVARLKIPAGLLKQPDVTLLK